MHACGQLDLWVGEVARPAEIYGLATDRRKEDFEVGRVTSSGYMPLPGDSTRRRSASLQPKLCDDAGRYHTGSMAAQVTIADALSVSTLPSAFRRPRGDRPRSLGRIEVRLGHGDGWPDVVAGCQSRRKRRPGAVAPQGSSDTMGPPAPLRVGADLVGRRSVGQVGTVVALERARRYNQRR